MLDFLFGSKGGSRRLDVATVSRRGLVRRDNQDHFVADRVRSFFAVADGMGGGQGGSEASEIVCANLAKAVDGKVEIDGQSYFFDSEGWMQADAVPAAGS